MLHFKKLVVASALSLCGASETLRATSPRRLSFELISGYEPKSIVTDHAAIDLDQKILEKALADGHFNLAKNYYKEGGHSKSYAELQLSSSLSQAVPQGTTVTGKARDGTEVTGTLLNAASSGSNKIKVRYAISPIQEDYVKCQVGALFHNKHANLEGCFTDQGGQININGVGKYNYTYDIHEDNDNARTLASLSKKAGETMHSCPTCPYYYTFDKFQRYYGVPDYGDQFVTAALDGSATSFKNGNVDFTGLEREARAEAVKKGSAYMNVWMYVIRMMEDALVKCEAGKLDLNGGAPHSWDQAVAFYSGSLEGADGKGDGKLIHHLADKKCVEFKTCGPPGDRTDGQAYVNHQIRKEFKFGQRNLVSDPPNCGEARKNKEHIERLMAVPLVQGALRYAHKLEFDKSTTKKEHVEGVTFAAAVLPLVDGCDGRAASAIYENMGLKATSTTFSHVKNAFQETYHCLGITCEEVGGYYDEANEAYFEGAEPCDPSTSANSNDKNTVGVAVGVVVGIVVAALVGAVLFRKKKKTVDDVPKKNPTFITASDTDIS